MNTLWVLVCDAARARLFDVREDELPWRLIEKFEHEQSRLRSSELVGDQSGRSSPQGASVHHNALAPASSPKEVEEKHFAHSLVTMLDQAMRARRFRRWVLVAPPRFLGMLRQELTPELAKHLMQTVDKDLSRLESHELVAHLRDAVRVPVDQRDVLRGPSRHPH
jgi:protein required for attachment to host cells